MKSRREFLRLVAVGSAAAVTGRAGRAAAAAKRAAKGAGSKSAESRPLQPPPAQPGAVRTEIERQKKSTAEALKTIRDYPLPAGSPMAFWFQPLRPARKGGH